MLQSHSIQKKFYRTILFWIPRETHYTLKTFIEAFKKESKTEEEVIKTVPMNNLTKIELDVLQQLMSKR